MKNENNNVKVKLSKKNIIFILLFIIITLIVGTLAWLTWKSKETSLVLTIGEINDAQVIIKPYKIEKTLVPSTNYNPNDPELINVEAVNKNHNHNKKIKLYYRINDISPELKTTSFKYTITKSTNNGSSYSVYKSGNFSTAENGKNMYVLEEILPQNSTYKYKVYVWLDGNSGNQGNIQGKTFNGELRAEIYSDTISIFNTVGSHTFKVPQDGMYKIELWGASPNNNYNTYVSEHPTYGGYTKGNIYLKKDDTLYFYVGGSGDTFNCCTQQGTAAKSGGATDARLILGDWNEKYSLISRIMVAGGGGGSYTDSSGGSGGNAGGLSSYAVEDSNHPVDYSNQTTGGNGGKTGTNGEFGIGGINSSSWYNSGAGGWYGGGSGPSGGGGSSYISGHTGCVTVASLGDTSPKEGCETGTTNNSCSVHPNGYKFSDTIMIDGAGYAWTNVKGSLQAMPKPDGGYYTSGVGHTGDGVAKISIINNIVENTTYDFSYNGDSQKFVAPKTGTYKIELWGASGGKAMQNAALKPGTSGDGGYTSGIINLQKNDQLYLYIGGMGKDAINGQDTLTSYNGGGLGTWDNSDDDSSGGGGGATDIRLISGFWSDTRSINSRIMVAGAGGGGSWDRKGGNAGGLIGGCNTNPTNTAGTQTSGFTLGIGENGLGASDGDGFGGSGSGYWGGKRIVHDVASLGSGGSSYISGHTGCVAITSESNTNPRKGTNNSTCETGSSDNLCSIHYSEKEFTDTIMIDGAGYAWTNTKGSLQQMPNPSGGLYPSGSGHTGNGHARITFIQ